MEIQIYKLKFSLHWNSQGHFIVALIYLSPTDFEIETEVKKYHVKKVSETLYKLNVFNCIVIFCSECNRTEEMQNCRDGSTVCNIYAYIPLYTVKSCSRRIDVTQTNSLIFHKADMWLLKNYTLFPRTVTNNFKACPLIVSTFEDEPFVVKTKHFSNMQDTLYDNGLEVKLINFIVSSINMKLKFLPPPSDGGKWGVLSDNGSWTGVLGELTNGRSDVAFGGVFYRCHITEDVECAMPHITDRVIWYIPCAESYPYWSSPLRVFSPLLWLVLGSSYFLTVLIFSSLVLANTYNSNSKRNVTMCSILQHSGLNMWAVLLGMSETHIITHKLSIRTVFILWVMYSLTVNTLFQSYLSSFMLNPGLQKQITTEEDLLKSGLVYGHDHSIESVLPDLRSSQYSPTVYCDELEDCVLRLARGSAIAVMHSSISIDYMTAARYVDSNGKALYCRLQDVFAIQHISLYLRKDNPLVSVFNTKILCAMSAGLMEYWWKDIQHRAILSASKNSTKQNDFIVLQINHLQFAFISMLFGYIISILSFLCELFNCCFKLKK
ncbi:Ionotropic receptor 207 [Blattella germanica]|nr:Ionotropic receptor 207 [Blattella germanica]